MLYKLNIGGNRSVKLEPLPFMDYANLDKLEKDLEILLSNHILGVLLLKK